MKFVVFPRGCGNRYLSDSEREKKKDLLTILDFTSTLGVLEKLGLRFYSVQSHLTE